MHVLAVNTGSASKKYALYEALDSTSSPQAIFSAHFEKLGDGHQLTLQQAQGEQEQVERQVISAEQYNSSAVVLNELLKNKVDGFTPSLIEGLGFRVIHGGEFTGSVLIDEAVLAKLEAIKFLAPLHNAPALAEIKACQGLWPSLPMVAVFDSAFHSTLPDYARAYAIPQKLDAQHVLRRYGFHGISYQSVLNKIDQALGGLPEKIIICHLGSGASITAIKNGESVDTSMGLTPLEGLVMGTRAGDIDAGLLLHLQAELKKSPEELDHWLNHECGLQGLSGKTSDVRELIELEKAGDAGATLALTVFAYRVKKYIGAYTAALNGLNLLVFTAAIGEGSPIMRNKICIELDGLGIQLDQAKNDSITDQDGAAHEGEINSADALVKVWIFKTDELGQIAQETQKLL
ncbi:MAG TPA: acetate/propionate family kinase [Candidatus Paceibacterota bacterium]|nr:acetate/propionate family kinase [Candidatus Paceibacterota bacterium]